MDIQVTRLDRAYQTAEELDKNTVTKSKNIAEEMQRITNNLNTHWRGADASNYINKWIDLREKIFDYFTELNKTTNFLQNNFVNMQMCRARTSNNTKVGDKTDTKYEYNTIPKLEPTTEYYYDEHLKQDYLDIEQLYNDYMKFTNSTDTGVNEIFLNWKIGIGRKEVGDYYQKISNYSKTLVKTLKELKDELAIIIANFEKIS